MGPRHVQDRLGALRPDPLARRSGIARRHRASVRPLDRINAYASDLARGQIPAHPFVLMGQMNRADPTRSPPGTETVWAYTHVPHSPRGDVARGNHRSVDRPRRRRVRRSNGSSRGRARTRVPLTDHRATSPVTARTRSARRESRRRRARWRHDGVFPTARVPAGARARSSRDASARLVPRVGIGASRRRRPWRVRGEPARAALFSDRVRRTVSRSR